MAGGPATVSGWRSKGRTAEMAIHFGRGIRLALHQLARRGGIYAVSEHVKPIFSWSDLFLGESLLVRFGEFATYILG